ncbi:hypothetical protein ACEPAF_4642 [Sanghuangporus sanghuang]
MGNALSRENRDRKAREKRVRAAVKRADRISHARFNHEAVTETETGPRETKVEKERVVKFIPVSLSVLNDIRTELMSMDPFDKMLRAKSSPRPANFDLDGP